MDGFTTSHKNMPYHTSERVITQPHHTYERVPHTPARLFFFEIFRAPLFRMCAKCGSFFFFFLCSLWVSTYANATQTHEACDIGAWVMSHTWMSHVTLMDESCHTHGWVMSHTWMSHVTHMDESCHTHGWVGWVMSHTYVVATISSPPTLLCLFWKSPHSNRTLLKESSFK